MIRSKRKLPGFHWVQGTAHYKLTTLLDLLKRRPRRYGVAPEDPMWRGGCVPTFATRRRAQRAAQAISTWGLGGGARVFVIGRRPHCFVINLDHYVGGERRP